MSDISHYDATAEWKARVKKADSDLKREQQAHDRTNGYLKAAEADRDKALKGQHTHGVDVCAYCAAGDLAIDEVERLQRVLHAAGFSERSQSEGEYMNMIECGLPPKATRMMADLRVEISRLRKQIEEQSHQLLGDEERIKLEGDVMSAEAKLQTVELQVSDVIRRAKYDVDVLREDNTRLRATLESVSIEVENKE